MTVSSDSSSGAEVAAAHVSPCTMMRKEQALEKAHLQDLERRIRPVREQLEQLQAAVPPNAEEISRVKALLDRLEEDIDRTRDNIESIQIDITMFCS